MKANKTVLQFAAAVALLASGVQTAVAQNLGSIGQAVNAAAPYGTVYFGIYPQSVFDTGDPNSKGTVLEAVEHSPAPLYPTGPFVVAKSDNQAFNGGALTQSPPKQPRRQATIMNVEPLKWQIVKDDADGFLLFADGNIDVQAYSNTPLPSWDGTWANSSLRAWLSNGFLGGHSDDGIPQVYKATLASYSTGLYNDLIGTVYDAGELNEPTYATLAWVAAGDAVATDYFTQVEKDAIVTVSLTNPTFGANPDNVTTQDKIFLPAADVVTSVYPNPSDRKSVNTRYVMSYENTTSAPADDDWLTRSHSTAPFPGYVTQVARGTGTLSPEAAGAKKAMRPALYLNRDKVLMVSQSKPGVSTSFTAASFSPSNTLKLTLVDGALPNITVTPGTAAVNGYIPIPSGDNLVLNYGGGSVTPNSYISCLLEDNTGIKYYTKAVDYVTLSSSVTLNFSGVTAGTYTLKVFNEIVNTTDKPDYASEPVSFDVYIAGGPLDLPDIKESETLSNGFEGRAYSDTVKLDAGTPAPVFSITDGVLPTGLSLNAVTGRISGTPAAGTAGIYPITVKASNPAGANEEAFTIVIAEIVPPVIATTQADLITAVKHEGYLSMPYSYQFALQPGTGQPSVKFSYTTGNLPQGLTLEENGLLHGTPTTVETQNFTICAETEGTYAYQSYTISILVSSSTLTLPVFVTQDLGASSQVTENTLFADTAVQITGNQYINVQYDPTTFPTGMTFDPSTWKILGTPILGTAGTYYLHLWAKNPATKPGNPSGPDSVGILYELEVLPANVPHFTTSPSLPAAAQGQVYSESIEADDASATLQFDGGLLPTGITFNPVTGDVSGTPTTLGTYAFKVKASNADGASSRTFTLAVQPPLPPPVIDPFTLPEGTVGETYPGAALTATNSPTAWQWTGAPAGLSLSGSGTVSGTPTAEGVYTVNFQATNAFGTSAVQTVSITIRQSPLSVPPTLVNTVADGIEGQAYHEQVFVFNRPDIVWTLAAGSLPTGLTFEDGVISGTPVGGEGKYTVTIKASSAGNQFAPVTKELTIWIMSFTEEYRSRKVELPAIAGMTIDRDPGIYYVKSGDDFSFVLTPHDAGVTPEVTTGRLSAPDSTGVRVTPNSDGVSFSIVILDIHEDVLIGAVPSANTPVEGAAKVWSAAGRLFISVTSPVEARIYNVAGRIVKTVSVEAGRTTGVTLAAGLYIVELDSGTAVYKVYVQ
ncbi:MAG: putative Ig domain-containing protein [Tannerella sp.]|jgi:hypothetical protein|nr:putative Ig domain-containing protein [Tannerella sp.]